MPPRSRVDRSKTASDVSTDVLMQVAQSVGKVEGTVNQMSERLGELADAQRHQAEESSHQHNQMNQRLTSIESRLGEGDRRFNEHQKRIEALEQQKKPPGQRPDSLEVTGRFLEFGKKYWPGIMVFFGAIYAYLERYFRGGSG